MVSRDDLQRLLDRPTGEVPVLSLYLDMSVTSENKRTHELFLSQQRSAHPEQDAVALEEALARAERWLADEFVEANKGVALFTELGGEWLEALQFPLPVEHRLEIAERPVVGPLVEVLEGHRRHLLVLVDREHMRAITVSLRTVIDERSYQGDQLPSPHDIQRGGYSEAGYQRRRAEEVRQDFKAFAHHVEELVRKYAPDDVVLVGTDENVKAFAEFLPEHVRQLVEHTAAGAVDAPTPAVLEKLVPFFDEQHRRAEAELVGKLHERVRQSHYATSGFHQTLEQLQEGKVDTLVIARDAERTGAQCTKCGFYLPRHDAHCPYCGGETRDSIDIVEVMIRMAADQDAAVEFVDPQVMQDLKGVGALLRF